MREARLYKKLGDSKVRCDTCAHHCLIPDGEKGVCRTRENRGGTLVSLVFGKACALHIDPIEKKPLFHFLPGARALSVATAGCNMHCLHCQNSDISQLPADHDRIAGRELPPEEVVHTAEKNLCRVIAYTYTEPSVFLDYSWEISRLARDSGIRNVFVTNGFWSEQGLKMTAPCMDAANVDLKFFRDQSYRDISGARLKPVLRTIEMMHKEGIWLEITTLIIPGINDSAEELADIAAFIADLDPGIPWHVSRFHPAYRMMSGRVTPVETLRKARETGAEKGLRYVYTGNIPGDEGENTFCHNCGKMLIRRAGFEILENRPEHGCCPECGAPAAGIWH